MNILGMILTYWIWISGGIAVFILSKHYMKETKSKSNLMVFLWSLGVVLIAPFTFIWFRLKGKRS